MVSFINEMIDSVEFCALVEFADDFDEERESSGGRQNEFLMENVKILPRNHLPQ
jgi:hypothetical protein